MFFNSLICLFAVYNRTVLNRHNLFKLVVNDLASVLGLIVTNPIGYELDGSRLRCWTCV